jgi:hypothetical protein
MGCVGISFLLRCQPLNYDEEHENRYGEHRVEPIEDHSLWLRWQK